MWILKSQYCKYCNSEYMILYPWNQAQSALHLHTKYNVEHTKARGNLGIIKKSLTLKIKEIEDYF